MNLLTCVVTALLVGGWCWAGPSVVWDSPVEDARGGMPLGNGEVGVLGWVEKASGDVLLYLGRTDSWEDNSRLAKIGLVRLKAPGLLGGDLRWELATQRGEMVVSGGGTRVKVWVDANHPLVQIEVEAPRPMPATVSFELWRTRAEALPSIEASDVNLDRRKPDKQSQPTIVEPDTVLRGLDDGVGWYHHNARSAGPIETMKHQGLLGMDGWADPILHRTFGALIRGPGKRRADEQAIESPAATSHRFEVYVVTKHPATPEQWLAAVRAQVARAEAAGLDRRRAAHLAWWEAFWDRSQIQIAARAGAADAAAAEDVERGYALQRYVTACAGRGEFAIKFNGSLFTAPWPKAPGNADYRRWGPGYWWQNTRLPYASMCASGDYEMLDPLWRLWAGRMLEVSKHRTKRYFGFEDAVYFPEVMYFWGAVFPDTYGRETTAAERTDKLQASGWHKWEWVGGLELSQMMLECFAHTGDERLLNERLLPTAVPVARFFDRFYKTGADGKLVMHPSQSLETWWDCDNPMPEVAGLHAVVGGLLSLPADLLPAADRAFLQQMQAKLPPLPTREVKGVSMLAPAARFANKRNVENPELYAVFPFRLVSFEKDNARLGVEALHARLDKGPHGWRHEDVFMAYLGLADEARGYVVQRARKKDPASRFPAFWGPNYDWTPDQCHGGVLMKALQAMVMQCEGDRIFVLPAWPGDWNVQWKLHAPRKTTVQGVLTDGKLRLTVTPPERRKDVVVCPNFEVVQ